LIAERGGARDRQSKAGAITPSGMVGFAFGSTRPTSLRDAGYIGRAGLASRSGVPVSARAQGARPDHGKACTS